MLLAPKLPSNLYLVKMSFHLDSDAVSLIALIVSLVALLIAFLQVIQQYVATASDYRRSSARTMGGWAKHMKRIFVLSEIRFEISFAIPHIDTRHLFQSKCAKRFRSQSLKCFDTFLGEHAVYQIASAPDSFPLYGLLICRNFLVY